LSTTIFRLRQWINNTQEGDQPMPLPPSPTLPAQRNKHLPAAMDTENQPEGVERKRQR
jgi:hypothetical protein